MPYRRTAGGVWTPPCGISRERTADGPGLARRARGITDSSFRLYAAVWSMDAEECGISRNENMLIAEVLNETVVELASRPGHEKVRALLYRLLVDGLGAASREIDFEKPAPEVNGRIDALLGRTVFEFKSDLRRERQDATGERYVGLATDGFEFLACFLRNDNLEIAARYRTDREAPRALLA